MVTLQWLNVRQWYLSITIQLGLMKYPNETFPLNCMFLLFYNFSDSTFEEFGVEKFGT